MKKRFIITTFLMLLFVSVALSTATYGWFTMSNTNTLDEFTIQARAASGGLEISLDGSTFYSDSVSMVSPSLKAMDVTSPDGVQFFKAKDTDEDGNPKGYEVAEAGTDYYEFDLYFRTSSAGYITLDGKNCYVLPENTLLTDGTNASTNPKEKANKSSFGDFSRNYIAGAVRVSLKTTGQQNSTHNTWTGTGTDGNAKVVYNAQARIITPDNEYDQNKNKLTSIRLTQDTTTSVWSIETDFANEVIKKGSSNVIKYAKGTIQDIDSTTYDKLTAQQKTLLSPVANATDTYNVIDDIYDADTYNLSGADVTSYGWLTSNDLALANLNSSSYSGVVQTTCDYTEGNIQITKVTCRIWIEGQDKEAKSALALGRFITSLSFTFKPGEIEDTAKLPAPVVTVNKGVARWTTVGNAVSYKIYNYTTYGSKFELTESTTDSEYLYSLKKNETAPTSTVSNESLTFQSLEAGKYLIQSISSKDTNNSDYYYFEVKAKTAPTLASNKPLEGKYEFTVVANETYEYAPYTVSGEASNEVITIGESKKISDNNATDTSLTLNLTQNGKYYVRTMAKDEFKESINVSIEVTIHTVLATPVLTLNGTTVSWNAVEGATGYKVFDGTNDVTSQITILTNDATKSFVGSTVAGQHTYKVVAVGDGALIDNSSESSPVSYTNLAQPTSVNYTAKSGENKAKLTWTAVENATSYEVYLVGSPDTLVETVTSATFEFDVEPTSGAKYYVIAKASGFITSPKSAEVTPVA